APSPEALAAHRRDLGLDELGPGVRQPVASPSPEQLANAQAARDRGAAPGNVALTGKEITGSPGENIATLKQKAHAYAQGNFADKTVTNASDGSQILITKAGIDHAFSGKVSRKAALASAQLDRILEQGQLVSTQPDAAGRPDIRAVHQYDTPITIAGKPVTIRSVVRELPDGRRYYDHFEVRPDGTSGSRAASGASPAAGAAQAVRTRSEARPTAIDVGTGQSTSAKPETAARRSSQVFAQRSEPFSAHTVAHVETDTGQHIFRSENGQLTAHESGPHLRVERIDVDDAARGKGEGTALMERALQEAQAKGLTLGSDVSVSPAQRKVYRALANRGWDVKQNPAAINETTKNLLSADPRVPVYEVRAPKGGGRE
ncbi:MAG: GNAT family N-acetyltransferase, partial [Steroidobacteraceae bacterium]